MDRAGAFPDVLREDDPRMGNSCGHWYGKAYYHLLWPDWPRGYNRETKPAVYLLDQEKQEFHRMADEVLCREIEEHFWQEIDEENRRMMNPQPGPFRTSGLGNGNPVQGFPGMMDGPGMMAPQMKAFLRGAPETDSAAEPRPRKVAWSCPACGSAGNTGRFCPECGQPKPESFTGWRCPNCGAEGNNGRFCPECGTGRPD